MTRIDEIIASALAGIPETDAAILAREVVRLREARAVVVPAWDASAFALACVKEGAYAEGDLRNAIKNAEMGYNFAISSARAIPSDRVLGEGMVQVRLEWMRDALALLMDFDNAPAPVSTSKRLYALLSAPEALVPNNRANQGGAAT